MISHPETTRSEGRISKRFWKSLRSITEDTRGTVAILFGISLIPTVGLIGLGIDYSAFNTAQRKLNAAADAVVLDAVARSSNSNLSQPTQDWATSTFNAIAGHIGNVSVTDVKINSQSADGNLTVKVTYTAVMNTWFGKIFNVPIFNINGSASSISSHQNYANFYFMLDNSPSMGFAATNDDISALQSKTPDRCAFACHKHTFYSGQITGDDTTDYYHIAKNNGINTRIDLLRTSTQQILTTALNKEGSSQQYKSAVYTFSDVLQTIAPLSSDLSAVKAGVGNVDLAYAYFDQRNSQTDFDTALQYMNNIVGTGGDGSNSASPNKYLLIVTDGVQDQPVGSASGSGDRPDHKPSPNQSQTSPPSDAMPNLANTHTGNVSGGGYKRSISALSSDQCDKIKANNVKIAILYTQYIAQTSDDLYNSNVAPIINNVQPQLQQCASSNLFFTVKPSQDISASMSSMFKAVTSGQPRLSN